MQAYLNEQEGWLNLEMGRFDLARRLLSKSLSAFHQAHVRYKECDLLFAMGVLHEREGDLSKAIRLFEQAAAIAQATDYEVSFEKCISAAHRLHKLLER
jgi:tetratricopeptide (TPR) repeat protein